MMKFMLSLITLACTANIASAQEFAHVVSKTQIVGNIPAQQQVCENSTVQVQPGNSGAGSVIGAVAGGLLGNTVGGGGGRAAATMAGVIAGSIVGDNVESKNAVPVTQNVQRCHLQQIMQNQVIGYNVNYEYAGRQYNTSLSSDPGDWVPVRVTDQGAFPAIPTLQAGNINAAPNTVIVQSTPNVIYVPNSYYYGPPPIGVSVGLGFGFYGHRRW
ncbi:glycine zipper 2TM domain-containing protein [Undibacterium sp. RuRC25W]|uniref:glycine zipper 2TM domain-containing protein n=1 Tax=Undibacterium sp. RuRC25W TaxID=3413047 RepID=UPI003BF12788